jgi:hypothetical protein
MEADMTAAEQLPVTSTPVLEAALAYASMGFLPVPVYGVDERGQCRCAERGGCPKPGKHPIGATWQKRASADVDTIRRTFARHVGNVGICLAGTPFVVLDFDGPQGLAMRDSLNLPETLIARSGSGGAHYVYRLQPWQSADEITDHSPGLKWDVKKRGQVVVAPSVHASGGTYEWTNEVPPAALPDVIYERIRKQRRPPPEARTRPTTSMLERARAYVSTMPSAIAGAGGHSATWNVARKLAQDFALAELDAWDVLCEYNRRCDPPWSEKELRHKLDDAYRARVSVPVEDRALARATSGGRPANVMPQTVDPSRPVVIVEGESSAWKKHLHFRENKQGRTVLQPLFVNTQGLVDHHPKLAGRIRYDEFHDTIVARDVPWMPAEHRWTDEDDVQLLSWLQQECIHDGYAGGINDVRMAVPVTARRNTYNPLTDYLDGLTWDGVPRLETFASRYIGSADTEYTRKVLRWWLTSAVARAYVPGCKADAVLVLEGVQGAGKSTLLRVLAGEDFFTDSPVAIGNKDGFALIRGRWFVELAELSSLHGVRAETAKQFLSSTRDDYRDTYGRHMRSHPRRCVFAGSTNLTQYLSDATGNRRYWPVPVVAVDIEAMRRDRDQVWAEAVAGYRAGARWYPETQADLVLLEGEQAEREEEEDPWEARIGAWLDATRQPDVSVSDVLMSALDLHPRDHTKASASRVGRYMARRTDWSLCGRRIDQTVGCRVRVYRRRAPTSP